MGVSIYCPNCRRRVGNTNRKGDVWLRVRSVVIQEHGDHRYVCPGCRQLFDVRMDGHDQLDSLTLQPAPIDESRHILT